MLYWYWPVSVKSEKSDDDWVVTIDVALVMAKTRDEAKKMFSNLRLKENQRLSLVYTCSSHGFGNAQEALNHWLKTYNLIMGK